MRQFIAFYLTRASQIVKQLKYVPLPTRGYELAIERVRIGRYGTAFGGKAEIAIKLTRFSSVNPNRSDGWPSLFNSVLIQPSRSIYNWRLRSPSND